MRVYLDYNIIVSIERNELSLKDCLNRINVNVAEIPYSSAHIQEIDNIVLEDENGREELIAKKLKTVAEISNGIYVYQDLKNNQIVFLYNDVYSALEAIREVPYAKPVMQSFVNLISFEQKEQIRTHLGIDPKVLNNYDPLKAIEHLNTSLEKDGYSFMGLIDLAFQFHPDGKTFGIHNRIAAIYELLDFLGYWKDAETDKSNYARLWDANHAFYASNCDYFISDDKRNRNKAIVAYEILGITTKITSSKGKIFN
ncbi:MAG: hypothetical protein BGO69_07305 [Bacteroidetes bacterium 46-16]|nr:MAG: hypothetical protein BGO69_07305 [Bacteroidetes bacterium 46-16]